MYEFQMVLRLSVDTLVNNFITGTISRQFANFTRMEVIIQDVHYPSKGPDLPSWV